MKKLKIILQCNYFYYFLLCGCIFFYILLSLSNLNSKYKDFNNKLFRITNITVKDFGLKLDLKGKEKVIGYIYSDEIEIYLDTYSIGDIVRINGEKKSLTNNTVPNTFNYKKYLYSNKIYSVIKITYIEKEKDSINIFYRLKNIFIKKGNNLKKSYPYINSLIFGNNSYIDENIKESYRTNGISHLFAISGLHISILLYVLYIIIDKYKYKNLYISLFLLFYVFLTSFSISLVRSSIFMIIVILNNKLNLNISKINILILTLFIILLNNPLALNNIGLQYSFIVTYFILKYKDNIKGNKITKLFKVSLIAFLASYPITINNFYQVNFLSVFYNIFFVLYVTYLLLPMTFIAYMLPFLDKILYFLISIIETLSHFLEDISILNISFCKLNIVYILIYYMVLIYVLKNKKKRYYLLLVLFFIIHFFMPYKNNKYV